MTSIFKKKKRYISMVAAVIMLLSAMYFAPTASAVDLNESESNNTPATADVTYDDYNNYGIIGNSSDVDWWKITPTKSGMMNFWLGNIPSGCNYNMLLCDASGNTLATSINSSNTAEAIRAHVYAGRTYTIKIIAVTWASLNKYLFRAKYYDLKPAKIFTSQSSGTEYDYRPVGINSLPYLWNRGYEADEFLHNTAATAFGVITASDIFVNRGHGAAGVSAFYHADRTASGIYGNRSSLGTYDRNISSFYAGDLTGVSLIMYVGCETGATSTSYGNLVDLTRAKGAWCVVGWKEKTHTGTANAWTIQFFKNVKEGMNVKTAMANADIWIYENGTNDEYYEKQINRHVGGQPNAVIL